MVANMPQSCDLQIRVRYAEVDPMGYLHHSRYLVYYEMGRTELLRLAGMTYRDCEDRGVFLVVAKIQCRFRAPEAYDDLVVLTTTVAKANRAKIEHTYQLKRDGRVLAEAESTIACVDRQGRLQPIPEFLLDP